MKAQPECIPCSIRQAIRTARVAGLDHGAQIIAARRAMQALMELNGVEPPAVIATAAIRASQDLYGDIDPFAGVKWESTIEALVMYQRIKPEIEKKMAYLGAIERMRLCAKLAAAGNIIDFGVGSQYDLKGALTQILEGDLAIDETERFWNAFSNSDSLLLISDNAGEIVFDRFILDEASALGKKVFLSVKSKGILNDATTEDALRAGISNPVNIIGTGSGSLGIILEECSSGFKKVFEEAGVVIAKGQANFETLDDCNRQLFFILRAKCPIVAARLGIAVGSSAFVFSQAQTR
ncbi:MAG: damage-control phosphatase ARMT1 family protein [bacterium]